MPATCDRVFGVPELAEMILLQLPIRDVLVNVQRTSRRMRDLVTTSLVLQQALFMSPIGNKALHYFNPELHIQGLGKERWAESDRSPPIVVIENPIVTSALRQASNSASPSVNNNAINYHSASWRRMLVTQPPVAELVLTRCTRQGVTREIIKDEDAGVRLEDVKLPLNSMREVSIAGWYFWQECGLDDECGSVKRRVNRRAR